MSVKHDSGTLVKIKIILWRCGQELYHFAVVMQPLWYTEYPSTQGVRIHVAVSISLMWQTSSELGWEGYSQKQAYIPSDRQTPAGHILGQQSGVDRHLCSTSCAHLVLNYPWHTSFHPSSQILLIWAERESSALRTHILHRLSLRFLSLKKQSKPKAFPTNFSPSFLSATIRKNTPGIQSTVDKVICLYTQNHPKKSVYILGGKLTY